MSDRFTVQFVRGDSHNRSSGGGLADVPFSDFNLTAGAPDPALTLLLFGAALAAMAAVRRRWRS